MAATLSEFLASQETLVHEAALALPHQFSHCTFSLGPIRQAVYLCTTCPEARGLCSACSIACHTDHEQIELFPKRAFRCDCPTAAIAHACTLHATLEPENAGNRYGQNFEGAFCRCGRPYDPGTERETMIQCLACEDWFHESCLNLRERPSPQDGPRDELAANGGAGEADEGNQEPDDARSEASSDGLPPPLISGSDYDALVCASCVSGIATLKRWAGTAGVLMVVRNDAASPWTIIGKDSDDDLPPSVEVDTHDDDIPVGAKRPRSSSLSTAPDAKRVHASTEALGPSSPPCLAPPLNPIAQNILSSIQLPDPDADRSLGAGDVFLTEGWRQRWCHCDSCLPSLQQHPYLLHEEETYEPPEDPDSGLSLEELGMRALERLPRDQAINGIHAFNEMRDDLVRYLRPFAQEGKVVAEADVRAFFDRMRAAAAARGRA